MKYLGKEVGDVIAYEAEQLLLGEPSYYDRLEEVLRNYFKSQHSMDSHEVERFFDQLKKMDDVLVSYGLLYPTIYDTARMSYKTRLDDVIHYVDVMRYF
jgi:hypothetical protein